ncbi:hypothetical protein EZJ49_13025 [Bdellovibrio bacteriovorus]|uniref:hypothetical protein n=1 Tax=Bdellovibrio bacteriovorus TaxID=959 RepID=UPI0021D12884|nr:hypothetical protein [Bdellovibrio bacteriovorus]UXR63987.1 hypothetical protein EZJ49_13025 [Bdellovibrio bacteriovorus]
MRDLSFTSEDAYKKRLTYFKVIYFLGLAVTLVYLLKFNYQYGVDEYNPILIPIWITLLLVPPLSLKFIKNYLVSASILCVMAVVIVSYFLYISGGVDAPGIFWLTAIPLICGILVGVPGAVLGYGVVVLILLFFWYARVFAFTLIIIFPHLPGSSSPADAFMRSISQLMDCALARSSLIPKDKPSTKFSAKTCRLNFPRCIWIASRLYGAHHPYSSLVRSAL